MPIHCAMWTLTSRELADKLIGANVETLCDTLSDEGAEALVDTLADTLSKDGNRDNRWYSKRCGC